MKLEDLNITFGADPEVAVLNTKTREYISPWDILPGTKDKPHRVQNGCVQVDGMAAEFNIDPAETFVEFFANIQSVYTQLEKIIKDNGGKHLSLIQTHSASYSKEYFDSLPDSIREVGCSPDFDALTGRELQSPVSDKDTTRYFGGHIHIGWTKDASGDDHFIECRVVTAKLSPLFTSYSLRHKKYGSNRFRPKSYGVELRQPDFSYFVKNANDLNVPWSFKQIPTRLSHTSIAGLNLREI